MLDVTGLDFHPVIIIPQDAEVFVHDFASKEGREVEFTGIYSIGKYDEDRQGMYEMEIFSGNRFIHLGIDIGAPVNTPVHAFADGVVYACGALPEPGDYGHAIITTHLLNGTKVWALYGHLSAASQENVRPGQQIVAGEVLGWLGEESENGGWEPHVHFQISLEEPSGHDMPGVTSHQHRQRDLARFPDPRIILGPLY